MKLLIMSKICPWTRKKKVYLVGFSLGCLLPLHAIILGNSDLNFDKLVLFSPAVVVKPISKLIKLLFLWDNLLIPSAAPFDYRVGAFTPISGYKAMHRMLSEIEHLDWSPVNFPTLVFIDRHDELVSFKLLSRLILAKSLNNWRIIPVTKDGSHKYKWHHLIIDELSVGINTWQKMITAMNLHLN